MVATDNGIYVSEKARAKVEKLMQDAGVADNPSYFLRVGVVGGGMCRRPVMGSKSSMLNIHGYR